MTLITTLGVRVGVNPADALMLLMESAPADRTVHFWAAESYDITLDESCTTFNIRFQSAPNPTNNGGTETR